MLDPYIYPGTDILKNVLDIQDRQMLDDAEADYVTKWIEFVKNNR